MRHGTSGRRSRNRNGGGRNGNRNPNNRSQVFDSNGPDVRIRGTAHQIHEKYTALANDANSIGDYVMAESYMQHAEHYQRAINIWQEKENERRDRQVENSIKNEISEEKNTPKPESKDRKEFLGEKENPGLPNNIPHAGEKTESKKDPALEDA